MCLNNYNKSYVTKNKEARKETSKRYYENNKDKIQLYKKEYDEKNKESLKIKSAQRSQKNKEHRNAKLKERRKNDLEFRIMGNLRTRVRSALNSKLKENKTIELIGCNIKEFKQWLEFQFDLNMNWNNYGVEWEIDHVIPCASFDLRNEDAQLKCFNWKNCRPLEKTKNKDKSNKLIENDINKHKELVLEYIQISPIINKMVDTTLL